MSLKNGFFLLALSLISLAAHSEMIQTCHLEGRIVLTQYTEFACFTAADFSFGKAQIITNGHELLIHAEGNIELDRNDGVSIVSYEKDSGSLGRDAARIEFEANSIAGKLEIRNEGYLNGCGGEVVFRVLTYRGFKRPVLSVASIGECEPGSVQIISQNGQLPLSQFLNNIVD